MPDYSFYFITGRKLSKIPVVETVKQAIAGGAAIIQYREKEKGFEEMVREAKELSKVCARERIPLIINDFPELAREVDAGGVHVGQKDAAYAKAREIIGAEKIVGVSANCFEDVVRIAGLGFRGRKVDYVGFGPIFPTATKADAAPATGLGELKRACEYLHAKKIPVVAIGGIDLQNVEGVLKAGADGVAVISAVLKSEDITATVKKFTEKIRSVNSRG